MNMLGCCVQCFDILRYLASSCLDQCLSFHIKSSKGTEMLWTTCLPLYSHMVLCDSNPSRVEPCRAVNACSTEEFSSWFVLPGRPGCPFVSDRLKQVRSDPGRRVSLDVVSVLQQPIARCRALCITGNVVNVAEAKERADFESETRSAGMPRILYTQGPRLVGCFALNSSISVSFSSLKVRVAIEKFASSDKKLEQGQREIQTQVTQKSCCRPSLPQFQGSWPSWLHSECLEAKWAWGKRTR